MKRSTKNVMFQQKQVADILGVHKNTIPGMLEDGRLKGCSANDIKDYLYSKGYEQGLIDGKNAIKKLISDL